jgi:HPt (histidine-containing phosphotransfer) domain-containing protein
MERTGFMSVEGGVDRDLALANVGGDRELLCELIEIFVGDTPRLMAAIDSAVDESDPEALRIAAHTLKGSASYFGAQNAVELSLELETMGRNASMDRAEEVRGLLHDEIARVLETLASLKAE